MKNSVVRHSIREGSRTATIIMYALAALVALVTLYPMYYVLILSVSDPLHAITMEVYTVPRGFSLEAYRILVQNPEIWRAFGNTVIYAASTTVLMLITSSMGAFPLTFKSLRGRKYLNMYLLITMFFGGGMIPSFLLIMKLGMYDSPLALIIPGCFSVWNIILVKA
jgi:putative aldouronate transport system permease protein